MKYVTFLVLLLISNVIYSQINSTPSLEEFVFGKTYYSQNYKLFSEIHTIVFKGDSTYFNGQNYYNEIKLDYSAIEDEIGYIAIITPSGNFKFKIYTKHDCLTKNDFNFFFNKNNKNSKLPYIGFHSDLNQNEKVDVGEKIMISYEILDSGFNDGYFIKIKFKNVGDLNIETFTIKSIWTHPDEKLILASEIDFVDTPLEVGYSIIKEIKLSNYQYDYSSYTGILPFRVTIDPSFGNYKCGTSDFRLIENYQIQNNNNLQGQGLLPKVICKNPNKYNGDIVEWTGKIFKIFDSSLLSELIVDGKVVHSKSTMAMAFNKDGINDNKFYDYKVGVVTDEDISQLFGDDIIRIKAEVIGSSKEYSIIRLLEYEKL